MVPGMPDKPEEPGPNPQSCDIDYSQSREWGHQGWLCHFQGGQKGQNQVQRSLLRDFHNISVVDLPLVKSIVGLSVTGLQCLHCILTQQFKHLWWQIDRAIIPFKGLLGS